MYNKGGNMLHTIRQIVDNDQKFRNILRGLNKTFYHKTVTTAEIENYMSKAAGKNFSKIFDQYLRTVNIPLLETVREGKYIRYRWSNTVAGFAMPVKILMSTDGKKTKWISPTTDWKKIKWNANVPFKAERNFYIEQR
jgi:aminopeptidase N